MHPAARRVRGGCILRSSENFSILYLLLRAARVVAAITHPPRIASLKPCRCRRKVAIWPWPREGRLECRPTLLDCEQCAMAAAGAAKRRFCLVLIKPSHYDDDGYVIQWWRSSIPSNSLSVVYTLAEDAARRRAPASNG